GRCFLINGISALQVPIGLERCVLLNGHQRLCCPGMRPSNQHGGVGISRFCWDHHVTPLAPAKRQRKRVELSTQYRFTSPVSTMNRCALTIWRPSEEPLATRASLPRTTS